MQAPKNIIKAPCPNCGCTFAGWHTCHEAKYCGMPSCHVEVAPKPVLLSGECERCHHEALLYEAKKKTGERALICWPCRDFIKELERIERNGKVKIT